MRGNLEIEIERGIDYLRCPISLELMSDPVTISTGHTYDRNSIQKWLSSTTGSGSGVIATCPITRLPLSDLNLIPNHTLRRFIQSSSFLHVIPTPTPPPPPPPPPHPSTLLALAASDSTLPAHRVSVLRRLAAESHRNPNLVASLDATRILIPVVFSNNTDSARESLAVVAMLPFSEQDCMSVAEDPDRIAYLTSLLFDHSTEVRVNSAAVIEMVVSGIFSLELRRRITDSDDIYEGVIGIINCPFSHPKAVRIGVRTLLALCLVKDHRHKAVAAGAVPALIDKVTDFEKHDAERALAVVELLCRTPSGCAAFAAHALTVPVLAKALLRVSERATEFAAGALLAMCVAAAECRKEAVAAGVVTRMLLVVQSKCTERAKRKAQALLKLLRHSWPEHCQLGSSDEYYDCNVVPF